MSSHKEQYDKKKKQNKKNLYRGQSSTSVTDVAAFWATRRISWLPARLNDGGSTREAAGRGRRVAARTAVVVTKQLQPDCNAAVPQSVSLTDSRQRWLPPSRRR